MYQISIEKDEGTWSYTITRDGLVCGEGEGETLAELMPYVQVEIELDYARLNPQFDFFGGL